MQWVFYRKLGNETQRIVKAREEGSKERKARVEKLTRGIAEERTPTQDRQGSAGQDAGNSGQ